MRETLIPLPDFLDAVVRACEVTSNEVTANEQTVTFNEVTPKRYLGIVVVLDRKAERRSSLLEDLVHGGSSINDVTRQDLLVALPGRPEDRRPGVEGLVPNPHENWHLTGAPGLLLAGADDPAWKGHLWELVSGEVERCDNDEDQKRIIHAVDQSASAVCDYLGLGEDDIPSLVLFSLVDRRVFVFRYGGDADDSPYQLFKEIARRRPYAEHEQGAWLSSAVMDLARESGLARGPAPELAPPPLQGWDATRYLPRGADVLPWQRARG